MVSLPVIRWDLPVQYTHCLFLFIFSQSVIHRIAKGGIVHLVERDVLPFQIRVLLMDDEGNEVTSAPFGMCV